MTVSVVTPSFNRGKLLTEAVDSALMQTYPDLDVTVVDDGSTDPETISILRELEGRDRVTVIRQANSGVAATINVGIGASQGEFILVLADDDRIARTYAEKAVPRLISDPDLGGVYCRARKFGSVDEPWILPDFSPEQMAISNCIFATTFFRRSDWVTLDGFRESLGRGYEDWDFWIRMIMLGRRFEQLPEELFFYRVGHSGLSAAHEESEDLRLDLYEVVYRENKDFFAVYAAVDTLLGELIESRRELNRWRSEYSFIDRKAGRLVRWALKTRRRLRG